MRMTQEKPESPSGKPQPESGRKPQPSKAKKAQKDWRPLGQERDSFYNDILRDESLHRR